MQSKRVTNLVEGNYVDTFKIICKTVRIICFVQLDSSYKEFGANIRIVNYGNLDRAG